MNWSAIRARLKLFDERGLSRDTIRNLKILVLAVMMGNICGTVTAGIAMTGYLRALGTSDTVYGILMALAPLMNSLQFLASYWMEKSRGRMKMFLVAGFIQRTIWLPFGLIPFIFPGNPGGIWIGMAACFMSVVALTGPFMNVSFYSLIADVVPMRIRGRYFAMRSRLAIVTGMLAGFVIAWILDNVGGFGSYALVFGLAFVTGIGDVVCYLFSKWPELPPQKDMPKLFPMMKEVVCDRNYMKVVMFFTLWNFAVQISSPFYNVYMIAGMQLSYQQITIFAQIVSSMAAIIAIQRWGRAQDFYGNKPTILIAGVICSLVTFMWTIAGPGGVVVVVIVNIITGAFWSPIDLGAQNLFLGQAPQRNRSMYIAIYFISTQLLGVALGNALGGLLLDNVFVYCEGWNLWLFGIRMTRYHYLFWLSGALRLTTMLCFLPFIKEEGAQSARDMLRNVWQTLSRNANMAIMQLRRTIARRRMNRQGK